MLDRGRAGRARTGAGSDPTEVCSAQLRLEDAPEGTLLTIVESGFDRVPAARRAEAFRMNEEGWGIQLENIRRHVAG